MVKKLQSKGLHAINSKYYYTEMNHKQVEYLTNQETVHVDTRRCNKHFEMLRRQTIKRPVYFIYDIQTITYHRQGRC